MTTYAGRPVFPAQFIDPFGNAQEGVLMTVYLRGTTTLATLYTDRTKATPTGNPSLTDARGNAFPYVDPGDYDALVNGVTVPFSVLPDWNEPAAGLGAGAVANVNVAADAAIAQAKIAGLVADLAAKATPAQITAAIAGLSGTYAGTPSGTAAIAVVTTGAQTVAGVKTLSDSLRFAAGAVALPSLTPSGDPDTGLWAPAANTLAWSTAGVERLRLDSAGNLRHGLDGQDAGINTRAQFPLPLSVPGRYEFVHQVTNFTDAGGSYKDSTFAIGYNPLRDAADISMSQNIEHKFRQTGVSPFATEVYWAFATADGAIARRPFQFTVKHTDGGSNLLLSGGVKLTDSAGVTNKFEMIDSPTGNITLFRTPFAMKREAADVARFWSASINSGADLAVLDSAGSLGLGAPPPGSYRLYLTGDTDFPRIGFENTTVAKTFSMGVLNSYLGSFAIDQTGIGNYFRISHTTGRMGIGFITGDDWFSATATRLGVRMSAANEVGIGLRAMSGQTADMTQWKDFGEVVLAKVAASGAVTAPSFTTTGLTGAANRVTADNVKIGLPGVAHGYVRSDDGMFFVTDAASNASEGHYHFQTVGGTIEWLQLTPPGSLETAAWLRVNDGAVSSLRRVQVGAADSGGAGKRALVVAN